MMKSIRVKIYEGIANVIVLYLLLELLLGETIESYQWNFIVLFFGLALTEFIHFLRVGADQKFEKIRCILKMILYPICGCIMCSTGEGSGGSAIVVGLYLLEIAISAVLRVILARKKTAKKVLQTIFSVLIFVPLAIAACTSSGADTILFSYLMGIVVLLRSLVRIMSIAFSDIRAEILKKIIRKTYAGEILFGLLLLTISFSMVFYRTEDAFSSYGDALWYSFAIITTIGFGDYTVVTLLNRGLSVILGIYGIIVVALITSIIVSFYMEISKEPDDEDDDEHNEAPEQKNAAEHKKDSD